MTEQRPILVPCTPFADVTLPSTAGRGVTFSECIDVGLATVLIRKGQMPHLARRLQEHFNIDLPGGPRRTAAGNLALAGIGPGNWLAVCKLAGNAFALSLRETLEGLASVSDQSDGYVVVCLSGPRLREALCKLVPVDIHPRCFKVGDVAATVAAHIGVTVWRLEDLNDGSAVFEVALPRSMSLSFWHALSEGAAEFGLRKAPLHSRA